MKTKAAFTRREREAVLRECERGERSAARRYVAALQKDLPEDLRSLVEDPYVKIKEAQARVRALPIAVKKTGTNTAEPGTIS